MATVQSIAVRTGTVGGVLFFLHISIPNCGNYPFIWPAAAGAIAFWKASRAVPVHRMRNGSLSALATAALVAVIGLLGISLVVFIVGHSQFSAASTPGLHGRLLVVTQAASMIATFCALAFAAAILGAVASMPLVWLRTRRSGAPAT